MRPPGQYKIRYQRSARRAAMAPVCSGSDPVEGVLARLASSEHRVRRIVDSLRSEILEGGSDAVLRVRQVFSSPREIYRVELERPELGYQRITLLDREALESLLEADDVRSAFELALSA